MEDNLLTHLKSANDMLDEFQEQKSFDDYSENSLMRLSFALKSIDQEVNKLKEIINTKTDLMQ